MKTILFVCTGNTCRSPMAEEIFRMETIDTENTFSEKFFSASAGLATSNGLSPSKNAILAMRELGRDISSHESSQLDEKMIEKANAVFAMTSDHLGIMQSIYPQFKDKLYMLNADKNISDPFGGDISIYRRCRDEIRKAIQKIIPDLKQILK